MSVGLQGVCVCLDPYDEARENGEPALASEIACTGCDLRTVELSLTGTLHRSGDLDFYEIPVQNAGDYAILISVSGLESTRQLYLGYLCPNGDEKIADCSGSSSSLEDSKFCVEDGKDTLRLVHECGDMSGTGLIFVGVGHKDDFRGPCDKYELSLNTVPFNN